MNTYIPPITREGLLEAAEIIATGKGYFMCNALPWDQAEVFHELLVERQIPIDGTAFDTPHTYPSLIDQQDTLKYSALRVEFLRALADELFPIQPQGNSCDQPTPQPQKD